jgi:hypothetical protein
MATDKKTLDICEMDLAGPVPPKPTAREKANARVAKFRERHGVAPMTVNLPADLLADFNAWAAAKGKNKSQVIAKLIESQLLRKR